MKADAVQAQIGGRANVTFPFSDYFMHVTDVQFLQTLMETYRANVF